MFVDKYIGLIVFPFVVVVPMNFAICWLMHVVAELLIVVIGIIIMNIQSIKCMRYNFNPMKFSQYDIN